MRHQAAIATLATSFAEVPLPSPRGYHVYLLILEDEVVYVGQTTNLAQRIGNHSHYFDFDRVLAVQVTKGERLRVEGALARRFNPRYTTRVSRQSQAGDARVLRRFGLEVDSAEAAEMGQRQSASNVIPIKTRANVVAAIRWHAAFRRRLRAMGISPKMRREPRGRLIASRLLWRSLEPATRTA